MYLRRRIGLAVTVAALAALVVVLASGAGDAARPARVAGGTGGSPSTGTTSGGGHDSNAAVSTPVVPALVVKAPSSPRSNWQTIALVHGAPAVWIAQRGGVTLMRFDQHALRLDLHAGSSDGGVGGWRFGDRISQSEIHHVVAAFNGGFKFTYADVGFLLGGRTGVPLKAGLASIVTYTDGTTEIGAWHAGVPSGGRTVFSVLQNQQLLVDHGEVAANAATCISACWGETIKGLSSVARSALGIRADGQLVWAAGTSLLPSELGQALAHAGVVRAVELDINPDWVAGYVYLHRPSGPEAIQATPGQIGIAGKFLEPYSRDFLTVVAR